MHEIFGETYIYMYSNVVIVRAKLCATHTQQETETRAHLKYILCIEIAVVHEYMHLRA